MDQGSRKELRGIKGPTLKSMPLKELDTCKKGRGKFLVKIYLLFWQFNSKWSCIFGGEDK